MINKRMHLNNKDHFKTIELIDEYFQIDLSSLLF